MSFNILILSSDRSTGANFAKSLQLSKRPGDDITIIGTSTHPGRSFLASNDITVLIPKEIETDPEAIVAFVQEKLSLQLDLVYESRSGKNMLRFSRLRDKFPVFLPDQELIEVFEDKFSTYKSLEQKNFPVPKTLLLSSAHDVEVAFNTMGLKSCWVRATMGQGGTGAFASENPQEIIDNINAVNGWGHYTLSEKLPVDGAFKWHERLSDNFYPGEMITWMALYHDDKLVAAQTRKRLYFEHQDLTVSGVGYTGAAMSLQRDDIHALSEDIVRSFGLKLNGVFGADFLVDYNGQPKVTEIQTCRFYTTTYFLSMLGLNFPRLYVDSYRGQLSDEMGRINPIEAGMIWLQRFGADDTLVHRNEMLSLLDTGVLYNDTDAIMHRKIPLNAQAEMKKIKD